MSRYNIALGKKPEGEVKKEETRVFEADGRINFVDTNNVLVGYDMGQSCCERADWFFSDSVMYTVPEKLNQEKDGLEGYVFDTEFFKYISNSEFVDGVEWLEW